MITAAPEPWRPTIDEMMPLLPLHWEELALDRDKVPLQPQWRVYDERDARGELQIVVLREDGRLIGYYWGFIAPGLHYASCLTATMDIFFVHPEHRRLGYGSQMLRIIRRRYKKVATYSHTEGAAKFFLSKKGQP